MTAGSWTADSTTGSTPSTDSSSAAHIYGKCRVPGCPNSKCKLPTHLKYKPSNRVIPVEQAQQKKKKAVSSDIAQLIRRDAQINIQSNGVDGLPVLPGIGQDPALRLLFHHFFVSVFEPLAHIFRGPSVASMSEYKNRMLTTALSSEGYCMGLIVQSQTDIDICRQETIESPASMAVYTRAVAALRKQIESIERNPHPQQIELALLTLCTLLSYDACHGRDVQVQTHWAGLRHLVERRGGMHRVTISLAYVIHVDRTCAQMLNQRPTFSSPAIQVVPLHIPLLSRSGTALHDEANSIRSPFMSHVLDHCLQTCCLLELWEISHNHSAQEPQKRSTRTVPSLEYLYYLRDRVDEQFTVLHADLWDQDLRDKCLLWAARIVEYSVTWSNQIPTINSRLCRHLLQALRTQDLSKVWESNINMLVWILFALATLQTPFDGRDQVIVYLRIILGLRHGELQQSQRWWQTELENVQSFVWSHTHNTPSFYGVCRELQDGVTVSNLGLSSTPFDTPSSSTLSTEKQEEDDAELESGFSTSTWVKSSRRLNTGPVTG